MTAVQHYATNYLENVKVVLISPSQNSRVICGGIFASLVDMSKSCPLMAAP